MATTSVILCLLRRKKKRAGSCFSSQGRNINLTENHASQQIFGRGQSRGESVFIFYDIPFLVKIKVYKRGRLRRQGHCITAALSSSKRFQSVTTLEPHEELRSWSGKAILQNNKCNKC